MYDDSASSIDRVIIGGRASFKPENRFIPPTVLKMKDTECPLMTEELFSPILPVYAVDSYQDGIELMNQREKPLALYVFSEKRREVEDIVFATDSGGVTVNHCVLHVIHSKLYFGGVGQSGMGGYHGKFSFETFSHMKPVVYKTKWPGISLISDIPLLYYPFAGGIDMRLKAWVSPADRHWVASYYGKKDKEQKAEIVRSFKEGEKRLIVATKAFGMGIDISDIDRVYHVAPSSTFVDYIQEIGRAARDNNIYGISATDFHERDFYYMKRLHQTGNISQEQLDLILKKLVEVYRMKGEKPEMQVSLSDFEFVVKLPRSKNKLEYEAELGQLIKTALLWLEDDLARRFGKPLIDVSPRNLLTDGYVQDKTGDAFVREYAAYLTKVEDGVYKARLEALWEERFPELGYKEFKQKLNNGTLHEGSRAVLVGRHDVLLKENASDIRTKLDALFKSLTVLMKTALLKNKGHFDEEELRAVFIEHHLDVRSAKRFIGSLLESRTEEGRSVSYISSAKKKESNELSFTVTRGFDLLLSRYQKMFAQRIVGNKGDRLLFYCTPFSDLNMLLNLLSMLDSLSFSVEGGGSPCVAVRFNDPEQLCSLAASDAYRNLILDANERIFQEQIELFTLFFGMDKLDDAQRWDFVEDYFTGMSVANLRAKYLSLSAVSL